VYLLNISESSYLALHGLYIIGKRSPEKTTAKYIAERLNGSRAHIAKIFQKLAKNRVVTSFCGPAGGFVITEQAKNLSLIDIFKRSGENVLHTDCPFNRSTCPFEDCILSKEINKLSEDLYHQFEKNYSG